MGTPLSLGINCLKHCYCGAILLAFSAVAIAQSGDNATVSYWRFEDPSILGQNTVEGGHLLETIGTVESMPVRGGALEMSSIPQTDAANGSMIFLSSEQGVLFADGTGELTEGEMTIEAIIQPCVAGTFSVIASRFGDNADKSWRFGFNTTSAVLHFGISSNGDSHEAFDMSLPTFRVNDFLFVAAAVKVDPTEGTTVKLSAKNLTQHGELTTSSITKPGLTLTHDSREPLTIGASSVAGTHKWIGALDEIRISLKALDETELLISPKQ